MVKRKSTAAAAFCQPGAGAGSTAALGMIWNATRGPPRASSSSASGSSTSSTLYLSPADVPIALSLLCSFTIGCRLVKHESLLLPWRALKHPTVLLQAECTYQTACRGACTQPWHLCQACSVLLDFPEPCSTVPFVTSTSQQKQLFPHESAQTTIVPVTISGVLYARAPTEELVHPLIHNLQHLLPFGSQVPSYLDSDSRIAQRSHQH